MDSGIHGLRIHWQQRSANWLAAVAWHATLTVLAVTLSMAVVGCGSESKAPAEAAASGASSAGPTSSTAKEGRRSSGDPLHPVVEIDTSAGKIRLRLDAGKAPATVRNFLNYANEGFYNNTLIHYVAADKMILGGAYGLDGQPKPTGRSLRNEAHNGLKNLRGTIAMARDTTAGIDTATSQFFINLVDSPSFDYRGDTAAEYGYCVFGEVVQGMEVAEGISRLPTKDRGGDLSQLPDPEVVVKAVRVVE